MSAATERQLVGLKSIHVGSVLTTGVTGTGAADAMKAFTAITQPYQGGVATNFVMPSSNEFFRENQTSPFWSAIDTASATKKLTWEVADFDDATLQFYFGTTESEEGTIYEGESAFVFDAKSGFSVAFARLKFVATLTGSMSASEPLRISVEATVLAPTSGKPWWVISTPEYTAKTTE
jgi:hypothetical protein